MHRLANFQGCSCDEKVDLEDYTFALLGYISKCVKDVTSTRTVRDYPNQKPWLNAEVQSLLKARDAAFRCGDRVTLRVKKAKAAYAQRIQRYVTSNNPQSMWRGIKCITNQKTKDAQCHRDPSLANTLNKFYTCFEGSKPSPSTRLITPPGEEHLSVTPAEVRRNLRGLTPAKLMVLTISLDRY